MSFSHKPRYIIFVERNKISVYPDESVRPLALSEEAVRYLEVRDANKLSELLKTFVNASNLRGRRVLVVLSKDVVFQKAVVLQPNSDPEAIRADFESKIPLEPADCQVLSLQQKNRLFLFGTNRAFYTQVVSALVNGGVKVLATVPSAVYGVTGPDKMVPEKIEQIMKAVGVARAANFLEV
ncbi:MAG TPA: hypothetical protein VJ836_02835 [Candidatus Saccharimonadales bacterium]|nr:hypothetical protein [Candidatus Saccharimonadales bacterium]